MKKGFTLIELLVVIAIIAILAAILFPVFAQAREKARQTQCLSNVKQFGTATQLYVDDYDETLPPAHRFDAWPDDSVWGDYPRCQLACIENTNTANYPYSPANITWADCLFPYVKNINMFVCPSYTKKTTWSGVYSNRKVIGYGYSYPLTRANITALSEIPQIAHTVFLSDAPLRERSDAGILTLLSDPEDMVNSSYISALRHTNGCNFCMADGHAKYCKDGQDMLAHNDDGSMKAWWQNDWWHVGLQK